MEHRKLNSAATAAQAPAKSKLEILLAKVEFSPDNVVDAAAINPVLFLQAINIRMEYLYARVDAKAAYERTKADAELTIRANARESGERVTEGNIEALLLKDPKVVAIQKAFTVADAKDEYGRLIVELFRMRRDCLRIVGDLARSEMSIGQAAEVGAERLQETRRQAQVRFPKEA